MQKAQYHFWANSNSPEDINRIAAEGVRDNTPNLILVRRKNELTLVYHLVGNKSAEEKLNGIIHDTLKGMGLIRKQGLVRDSDYMYIEFENSESEWNPRISLLISKMKAFYERTPSSSKPVPKKDRYKVNVSILS